MKTLIELKQAAESKGLRFEVNKWDPTIRRWETDKVPNPDFMKIEIGILKNSRGNSLISQSEPLHLYSQINKTM